MNNFRQKISTFWGLFIIVVLSVLFGGLTIINDLFYTQPGAIEPMYRKQMACPPDENVCPNGLAVGRTGPECDFEKCPEISLLETNYNHAGEIKKVYQKDGKKFIDIDFIKFLLFSNKNMTTPSSVYGANDEIGNCAPVANPYCVLNNDKTIASFELADNVKIITGYSRDTMPISDLNGLISSGLYFEFLVENNVVQKISQIYIP